MRILDRIENFVASGRFAVLFLSILFFFTVLVVLVIAIPADAGPLAKFAQDFKVWCFRYDPATGQMEWIFVFMFLLQPLLISLIVLAAWWSPIRQFVSQFPRLALRYVGLGVLIVGISAGAFVLLFPLTAQNTGRGMPFPVEKLRTHFPAPDFTLVDQNENTVALKSLRGKVVLMTAVYSRCGSTCPLILSQLVQVLKSVSAEEARHLEVAIITLDPEYDSPPILKKLAQGYGLDLPYVHFLTGMPATVNAVLDQYNVARQRELHSTVISHANLFFLIDRNGRVAFRFSLGEQQREWLVRALKLLIDECRQPLPVS